MHGLDPVMILSMLAGVAAIGLAALGALAWFGYYIWKKNIKR